jgi:signal peptidase I
MKKVLVSYVIVAVRLCVALGAAYFIGTPLFFANNSRLRIDGSAMPPNLYDGDLVFADERAYQTRFVSSIQDL